MAEKDQVGTPASLASRSSGEKKRGWYELLTLPLPYVLWWYSFGDLPPGFWVKLSVSGLILLLVALTRRRDVKLTPSFAGCVLGVASAVLLYLFFWSGYHIMESVPGFVGTISSVYAYAGGASTTGIALVLLFPIGPAEEFYWRGFIQRRIGRSTSAAGAVLASSLLYTSIHVVTLNPSLLLVAFIGGLVWGGLYARYRNLFPVLVSHIIFDELIFVFLTIH